MTDARAADTPRTDTRLTRTPGAQAGERTEVTAVRGRAIVRAAVRSADASRALRAAAGAALRWLARTVRPAGMLALAAATVGLAAGLALGWVEAIAAGALALLLIVAAVPFLFGARSYTVDLALARERIVAGSGVAAQVVVRNTGIRTSLPGRIEVPVGRGLVDFGVPLLRPGRDFTHPLEIPSQPRGVLRVGPATTVRSDPLGLLRREHALAADRELFVHPRTAALPTTSAGLIRDLEGRPTRRLVDADISFHAIREYAPGDARRQIHWRSTAKTGRLMVRQYEETRRSRMAVVLGVASDEYAAADEFELAVSCAASLAVRAIRDAREIDIVVGAEIPRVVRGRLRAIRHLRGDAPRLLLDGFSGVARLAETMPLAEAARLVAEADEHLSIAVLVAGSRVGLARLRRAALAFAPGTAVVAIVCDESAHPRVQTIADLTVLTVGTLDDLAGLLARRAAS